jgi:MOSC domain-containing protein YiiM
MTKGTIFAISISPKRGQLKKEIPEATFIANFGIAGDGHGGDWGRQVTCLSRNSVKNTNAALQINAGPGDFAENILIDEIDLSNVKIGNKIHIADSVVLEVTQIGKEDHPSIVSRTLGVSLLPKEGLFCKVLEGGRARKGDPVSVTE